MQFRQLNEQDKFFLHHEGQDLVLKKVPGNNIAADVRVSGDGRIFHISPGQDVGDVLTDEQAEAKLQELAEARRKREEEPAPLMAGFKAAEGEDAGEGETSEALTAADVRKMKRAELDELAKEYAIDLEDKNVEESKDHLIQELGLEEEANV